MNFVVTGGAGFIGSHITHHLVERNYQVTVIDDVNIETLENFGNTTKTVEFKKINILNYEDLRKAFRNVDGVFHHAALIDVQESFRKPDLYYDVNVKGTENILKIAEEFNIKVVFASSAGVYGNPEKIPIKETAVRKPLNPYGITKLECEKLAEKYSKRGNQVLTLRYFNVFGKRQTGSYAAVITRFLDKIKNKMPPEIFGDGSQTRDFIYVDDVVSANLSAMKSDIGNGFFNIGTGIKTSIKDLANLMIELSGYSLEPLFKKPVSGDIKQSQADISLANKLLNWKPKISLREGLINLISNNK